MKKMKKKKTRLYLIMFAVVADPIERKSEAEVAVVVVDPNGTALQQHRQRPLVSRFVVDDAAEQSHRQ